MERESLKSNCWGMMAREWRPCWPVPADLSLSVTRSTKSSNSYSGYWHLTGREWSRDQETGLSLVDLTGSLFLVSPLSRNSKPGIDLVEAIFVRVELVFLTSGMWNTGEAGLGGGLSASDDDEVSLCGLIGFRIGDLEFVTLIGFDGLTIWASVWSRVTTWPTHWSLIGCDDVTSFGEGGRTGAEDWFSDLKIWFILFTNAEGVSFDIFLGREVRRSGEGGRAGAVESLVTVDDRVFVGGTIWSFILLIDTSDGVFDVASTEPHLMSLVWGCVTESHLISLVWGCVTGVTLSWLWPRDNVTSTGRGGEMGLE